MQTGIRRPCRGSISTPGRRVWTGSGQRRLTISPEMADSRRSNLRFIRGDSIRSTAKSRIRVVPKNHVLHVGPDPLWEGAILGERGVHCKVLSTVSCAKMAEPIDLSFGLWTRVSRRKQEFTSIRQVQWYWSSETRVLSWDCLKTLLFTCRSWLSLDTYISCLGCVSSFDVSSCLTSHDCVVDQQTAAVVTTATNALTSAATESLSRQRRFTWGSVE